MTRWSETWLIDRRHDWLIGDMTHRSEIRYVEMYMKCVSIWMESVYILTHTHSHTHTHNTHTHTHVFITVRNIRKVEVIHEGQGKSKNVLSLWVMSPIYESCLLSMSHVSYLWFMSPVSNVCYLWVMLPGAFMTFYISDLCLNIVSMSLVSYLWVMSPIYESCLLSMSQWCISE